MPAAWCEMIKDGKPDGKRSRLRSAGGSSSPRNSTGMESKRNHHAGEALLRRFRSTGFSKARQMAGGHGASIPKASGKDACLAWALKGACHSGCSRKASHSRYSIGVNNAIHNLMDECGVARAQE